MFKNKSQINQRKMSLKGWRTISNNNFQKNRFQAAIPTKDLKLLIGRQVWNVGKWSQTTVSKEEITNYNLEKKIWN